jgi:hypothetical protein
MTAALDPIVGVRIALFSMVDEPESAWDVYCIVCWQQRRRLPTNEVAFVSEADARWNYYDEGDVLECLRCGEVLG